MDKQPVQRNTSVLEEIKRSKKTLAATSGVLYPSLAFVLGWALAFIFAKLDESTISLVVMPLLLGIVAPLTVGRRTGHIFSLSILTGLLAIAGIYTYWLPIVIQEDAVANAYCATHYCHVGGIGAFFLTSFFLPYAIIVMLVGATITGLIVKYARRKRVKGHELFKHEM